MRPATRSTSPTTTASMSSADLGLRPSACCEPIERRRRPTTTGRGSRLWARACRCRPDAGPSIETSDASVSRATSPTVMIPRAWSFSRGRGPDAPESLDAQRMEEVELARRRHHQEPVGLRHSARHLGQELGPRHADRDGQPDTLEDVRAATAPRSRWACPRLAAGHRRRGTLRRSRGPRPTVSCRRTP